MDWDAWRAHLVSVPAREGLGAMAREIDPRLRIVRVRRLGGGLATATHAVDLRSSNGSIVRTVVKRYGPGDVTAPAEWARLRFAARLDVPVPEPLALDRTGAWFGAPALVMRRLDGRADHSQPDDEGRLRQIASALVSIASGSKRGATAGMRRPFDWKEPRGLKRTALTEPAIAAVRRAMPRALDTDPVVAHADFHPGNLLWVRGRLSGVADWNAARLAPRAFDVAYCRADLTVLAGPVAAARFLQHYERLWGGRLDHLPVWDLACALGALRSSHLWAIAYAEQGRTGLTTARVKARAAAMVRRALAQL